MIRYSSRFPVSLAQNAHSLELAQIQQGGEALLDLTVSNPTQTLANYPSAAIAAQLGALPDLRYRPEALGIATARETVAAYYQQRGFAVDPSRIALTASTSDAYSLLFKLLCDPEDQVLVPTPSYPLFEHLARFDSVRVVPYPLQYDGVWHIDFAALESRVTARTRAVVVVNPNNPTGSYVKLSEAERLLSWASSRGVAVISDEVFMDYQWTASASVVSSLCAFPDALSFSLNGLSKAAGMPQMKLGWIVVNGPAADCSGLLPRLEFLLDTYLSLNTPVQCALPGLLAIGSGIRDELTAAIQTNLSFLHEAIADEPLHCLTVEGGWTAILRLPHICSEQDWVRALLHQQSVLVQPGYFFDMPAEPYIVVSLITPAELFATGIHRTIQLVRERLTTK